MSATPPVPPASLPPPAPLPPAGDGPLAALRSTPARALALIGLLALGLVFFFGGDGAVSILDYTMALALAALGLNVLTGYAGQISLGISFFMGVGAYTAAWLGGGPALFPGQPSGHGLSFVIWLPAAGVVAALAGALIGPTALRLKGFYLAIVTLALVFIGQYLFLNLKPITGGTQGFINFPTPQVGSVSFAVPAQFGGLQLTSNQLFFLLLLPLLALAALFVANVARTRAGRAWQAVRDNETAAAIMGVNLFQTKMGAFILSSFLAGIAGALYASLSGISTPGTWGLLLSIQCVAAILIGGVASVWGSILGAAFVFALPIALDTFSLLPQSASATGVSSGDVSAILYGLLIVVFLLFEPAGVVGLIHRLRAAVWRLETRDKGGETASAPFAAEPSQAEGPAGSEPRFDVERAPIARSGEAGAPTDL